MQQPMNTNPVQVVVIAQPIDKHVKYRNMRSGLARQLIGLGVMQLLIGVLCIIFQGIALGIYVNGRYYSIDFIGHGFWTGLMFLITGPLGIAGGIKRNRCQVVAFNVLSILSAAFAACLISISIPGAILYAFGQRYCDYVYYTTTSYNNYYYSGYYDCNNRGTDQTGIAMEAMMAILGLIEGIIAIWSSVICCTIGACCCNCGGSCCCPTPPPQQFLMTGQPFPGQQQIIIANQQQSGPNQHTQFLLNSQQIMFSPNQQQPVFALSPQQPIHLDPRQQMAQYNPQQPNLPPYSQQSSAYTALTPASKDQGPYTGLYTEVRNTIMAPEQHANRGGAAAAYD